jgi:iron complex transport system substrate-binding protein
MQIAQAIGADSAGFRLNQAIATKIGAIPQVVADTKIAFLYLRGGSAIYLLGGQGAGADDLIASVGAIDVGAARYDQPFTPISSEALISADPDIILVMQKGLASVGGVAGLIELPGIAQTTAGKNGAVIAVDDSLLLSFGPRTPDLLERLSKAISELSK